MEKAFAIRFKWLAEGQGWAVKNGWR